MEKDNPFSHFDSDNEIPNHCWDELNGFETSFDFPSALAPSVPQSFDDSFLLPDPLTPPTLTPTLVNSESWHKRFTSSPGNLSELVRIASSRQAFDANSLRGLNLPLLIPTMTTHARQNSTPVPNMTAPEQTDSDREFRGICSDDAVKFNPVRLGFIPTKFWNEDKDWTFGQLVEDFFQKKNNANSRFSHKLYNALKISTSDPFYAVYIGVEWLTERVLKVDKWVFARLLGIKTIDGSLFHQQGNFPSHGFVELSQVEARRLVAEEDLADVDYENVRLLVHQPGIFTRDCTEQDIERCKWVGARRRV